MPPYNNFGLQARKYLPATTPTHKVIAAIMITNLMAVTKYELMLKKKKQKFWPELQIL